MAKWLRRWGLCTRGQGLIEYAFILALVVGGLVSVLLLLRTSAENTYNGVGNNLSQVACDGTAGCVATETGGTSTGGSASSGGGGGGERGKSNSDRGRGGEGGGE